jgi:hypothetical protein
MKVQMQITLPASTMEGLREEARTKGVTPNILLRMAAIGLFDKAHREKDVRVYQIAVEEPGEIEAYVKAKRLGSVADFANYAMELAMSRAPLTPAQKRRADNRDEK